MNGKRIGVKRRPFATTPSATNHLLAVIIEQHPESSIADLVEFIHYDMELREIITDYIHHGWGHLRALSVFSI